MTKWKILIWRGNFMIRLMSWPKCDLMNCTTIIVNSLPKMKVKANFKSNKWTKVLTMRYLMNYRCEIFGDGLKSCCSSMILKLLWSKRIKSIRVIQQSVNPIEFLCSHHSLLRPQFKAQRLRLEAGHLELLLVNLLSHLHRPPTTGKCLRRNWSNLYHKS